MNVSAGKGGHVQRDIWRLALAFRESMVSMTFNGSTTSHSLVACVAPPYILLSGPVVITLEEHGYSLESLHCNLTNCLSKYNRYMVVVLQQPSFVMLPVNLSGPWYEDAGVQTLMEVKKQLGDQRVIGIIIAGL